MRTRLCSSIRTLRVNGSRVIGLQLLTLRVNGSPYRIRPLSSLSRCTK